MKEGEYNAYGRELEIERGRLLFTGGPVTDPGVDLRAMRELPGYKVGVIARGPLRQPQLAPVFGSRACRRHRSPRCSSSAARASRAIRALRTTASAATEQGGAILAGQLGKYVGIDDIGLTQDEDTGSELVLGKYLSPRLEFSYGTRRRTKSTR